MSKSQSRKTSTSERIKTSQRHTLRMTVHQRNDESRGPCFPAISPSSKNHWPGMENDSSSWDRNSRATSSSWPGDMEEAATRKIIQLWEAIERTLFSEDDQMSFGPVADECNQWRTQLIHLRIIGKGFNSGSTQESNETVQSSSRRAKTAEDRSEEIILQDSLYETQELSSLSRHPRLTEDLDEVFDQILNYVCSEFTTQNEKKATDSLSRDLDEVLRITPAPTYSARQTVKGRKKRNSGGSRKSSANDNHELLVNPSTLGENQQENDRLLSEASRKMAKNSTETQIDENVEKDEQSEPQVARNKLGTVFNEKIVVSPVPFVVSTRESFTTLRTTPISFRAQTFEFSTAQGLGRYMNSASKTNSAQRMSALRLPQRHSAWQVPVCPTVWPKNIRLAPIDPSRFPSSKNRSSTETPQLPQRNRNSLSPITRPQKLVTSATLRDHNVEGLEIHGKQIVTRSPKQNLLKSSWNGSPRIAKNCRPKTRTKNERQ